MAISNITPSVSLDHSQLVQYTFPIRFHTSVHSSSLRTTSQKIKRSMAKSGIPCIYTSRLPARWVYAPLVTISKILRDIACYFSCQTTFYLHTIFGVATVIVIACVLLKIKTWTWTLVTIAKTGNDLMDHYVYWKSITTPNIHLSQMRYPFHHHHRSNFPKRFRYWQWFPIYTQVIAD